MLLQSVPNPDYMNGTADYDIMSGVDGVQSMHGKCGCGAPMGSNCGCVGSMGTTGSLGVSFAAPLTRGGFAGEIFDTAPMPTGSWKDAPAPVMLGTGGRPMNGIGTVIGALPSLISIGISCAVWYGAYKYYFSKDCKCNK